MTPTPMERGRRAADAVKAAGGLAMDCALAQIETTFDEYAAHHRLRSVVRRAIHYGPSAQVARGRYGRHIEALPCGVSLDQAIRLLEQSLAGFQRIRRDNSLGEIILLLRHMRRFGAAGSWEHWRDNITAPLWAEERHMQAAE